MLEFFDPKARGMDRMPPFAQEAEVAVLGGCLIDPEALPKVQPVLSEHGFYREAHRRVYRAMLRLAEAGTPIEPVTVSEELTRTGELDSVGGMAFVAELLDVVPTGANVEYHARIVRDRWRRRQLIEAGTNIVRLGYEESERATDELVDEAHHRLFQVADSSTGKLSSVHDLLHPTIAHMETLSQRGGLPGVPTGFEAIDEATGGLMPGNLVLIAARPSMGKSALTTGIMLGAAMAGKKVAVFSLEMSKQELVQRMLAHEALVDLGRIIRARMHDSDYGRIAHAAGIINHLPIFIDDSGQQSPMDIRSKARKLKQEEGLDLIIVDYIQLMSGEGDNRTQVVSDISRSLKLVGKDLGVPVVGLSQLTRGPDGRADRRPQLSDLRESGSLEQDADMVAFLYRHEYYLTNEEKLRPENQKWSGHAEFIIGKQRNGPTGMIELRFLKEFARFESASNWGVRVA